MKLVLTVIGRYEGRLPAPFPARGLIYEHNGRFAAFYEVERIDRSAAQEVDDLLVLSATNVPTLRGGLTFHPTREAAAAAAQKHVDLRTTRIVDETYTAHVERFTTAQEAAPYFVVQDDGVREWVQ